MKLSGLGIFGSLSSKLFKTPKWNKKAERTITFIHGEFSQLGVTKALVLYKLEIVFPCYHSNQFLKSGLPVGNEQNQ